MDTRTGQIHEMADNESFEDFVKRIGVDPSYLVSVENIPDATCKKCNGTGAVRKGMFSKRWKPCGCTK